MALDGLAYADFVSYTIQSLIAVGSEVESGYVLVAESTSSFIFISILQPNLLPRSPSNYFGNDLPPDDAAQSMDTVGTHAHDCATKTRVELTKACPAGLLHPKCNQYGIPTVLNHQ